MTWRATGKFHHPSQLFLDEFLTWVFDRMICAKFVTAAFYRARIRSRSFFILKSGAHAASDSRSIRSVRVSQDDSCAQLLTIEILEEKRAKVMANEQNLQLRLGK
jgi:hypothetical protein